MGIAPAIADTRCVAVRSFALSAAQVLAQCLGDEVLYHAALVGAHAHTLPERARDACDELGKWFRPAAAMDRQAGRLQGSRHRRDGSVPGCSTARDARVRAEQVARELAESSTARLRFLYFILRPDCSSSQGATARALANRSTLTRLMFRCARAR